MRYEVEVRIGVSASVNEVSALATDPGAWPPMPGADVTLHVERRGAPDHAAPDQAALVHFEYRLESGLPVRDHLGELAMTDSGRGGTELVFTESFRPRIWGTGGFLRARRERALIETARHWDRLTATGRATAPPRSDTDSPRLDA